MLARLDVNYQKWGGQRHRETVPCARDLKEPHDGSEEGCADSRGAERLTARDALCLLVGCMLTVLDEAPSDEERQQSLDNCIDPSAAAAAKIVNDCCGGRSDRRGRG
jgi:hypothetical protein